jgi:hypothetical protein
VLGLEQVPLRGPGGVFGGPCRFLVIGVLLVLGRRVEGENRVRLEFAEQEDQARAHLGFRDGVHFIVAEIERVDLLDADDVGRGAHLRGVAAAGFARVQIVGVLFVVGDADEVRGVAVIDHPGDRAAGEDGEVVGMRRNDDHGAAVKRPGAGGCGCRYAREKRSAGKSVHRLHPWRITSTSPSFTM